jgi:cell fate (sporulation/competence/biofilm development) regulator YmcA (YheA/YmcA/DUF963 family)
MYFHTDDFQQNNEETNELLQFINESLNKNK